MYWKVNMNEVKLMDNSLFYLNSSPLEAYNFFNITDPETSRAVIIGDTLMLECDPDTPTHNRVQFNVMAQDLGLTDDVYIRVGMQLPESYIISPPHDFPTWGGWHEFFVLSEWMQEHPSEYLWIGLVNSKDGISLYAKKATYPSVYLWTRESSFKLPLGEWFDLEVHIVRHVTNGVVSVKVNGIPIFTVTGIQTKIFDTWHLEPLKLYGGEVVPKRIGMESLELSDETFPIPEPEPPEPPSDNITKFAVALTGILTLTLLSEDDE